MPSKTAVKCRVIGGKLSIIIIIQSTAASLSFYCMLFLKGLRSLECGTCVGVILFCFDIRDDFEETVLSVWNALLGARKNFLVVENMVFLTGKEKNKAVEAKNRSSTNVVLAQEKGII